MGGSVSAGENNDDLIDNLVEANYIISKEIEEIFRAVDRGNYYLPEYRESAYHDMAWRHDHLHISAPCIYSKVMSSLNLKPGLSFLNIGSGTGYLSTMAGLVLGICGINHGIELHQDVVDYARAKVQEFVSKSRAFDRYTFCEPQFVTGNCLHISPDSPGYDRIYCGAACPQEYESFMKNLLNINGLLIMPFNDQLQVITRTGQTSWETENILVVNFANLVVPSKDEKNGITVLPNRTPPSLSSLCRACIRQVLSTKFHFGSNRRFAKRKPVHKSSSDEEFSWTIGRTGGHGVGRFIFHPLTRGSMPFGASQRHRNFPDSDTDSDRPSSDRRPRRRCGTILNIVTSTLSTVASIEGSSSRTDDDEQPSASSCVPPEEMPDNSQNNSRDQVDEDDDDDKDRPSTSMSFLKKKNRKKKNSSGTETNGTAKRPKKGWALIRQRIRNRFTDKLKNSNVFSTGSVAGRSSTVDANDPSQSPKSDNDSSSANRSNADTSGNANDSSVRSNVRSLLVSMTTHSGFDAEREMERRLQRNIVNFLNARRNLRNPQPRHPPHEYNSDDSDPEPKSDQMEEIPLPPDDFQSAILKLPLPHSVKNFLLFYRTPN